MADDPGVIHAVSRCGALCVIIQVQDLDGIEVANLEHRLAKLTVTIALRFCEPIVINFRLCVMVWRIA